MASDGTKRGDPVRHRTAPVRPGIRLQLIVSLAALMLLAFVPLYVAVASLTQTTLRNERASAARSLGRAVAAHVSEARRNRPDQLVQPLLDSEIGSVGLEAIAAYSPQGRLVARAGETHALDALPDQVPIEIERARTVTTSRGRALEVLVPGSGGPVIALLRTDDEAGHGRPLLRLVGLYTAAFALALLVFAYLGLTRMLVRPIDQLSNAARRVSEGARALEVPLAGPREIAQLGSSFAEMTRRLRAEEQELRSKVDQLQTATQELKSAQRTIVRSERLATVGRLAAGLAHEIGNPISAILGFEDLLLSGGLEPEEQRDFLERMKKETERISRVLRQLLDFARSPATPAGQAPEPPAPVVEAVQDVSSLLRPHKALRDIELATDIDPALPVARIARSQLVQVLLNLLLNAADATGPGGKIVVRAQRCEFGVRIEVQDNGPGIRPDVRDKLFEPFVTTKEVGVGTGLGLAICRNLVEAEGGSITVQDAPGGRGALFVIELPIDSSL
jgi:two-component system, NtrC family, sensor kinase